MSGKRYRWLVVPAGAMLLVSVLACKKVGCNEWCDIGVVCTEGLVCEMNHCRNPECTEEEDCECPKGCNEACETEECGPGLECADGVCRNPDCTQEEDCKCPVPAACNEPCENTGGCVAGLDCVDGICVNAECPKAGDCECPAPAGCSEPCEDAGGCAAGLDCEDGICVNSECPKAESCVCPLVGGCNEPCELVGDCEAGLLCLDGTCTAVCPPEEEDCGCPDAVAPYEVYGPLYEFCEYAGTPPAVTIRLMDALQTDPAGDQFFYIPDVELTNPGNDIVWYLGTRLQVAKDVTDYWFGPDGLFGCEREHTYCSEPVPEYEFAAWEDLGLFAIGFSDDRFANPWGRHVFSGVFFNLPGEIHVAQEPYLWSLYNGTNDWHQFILEPTSGDMGLLSSQWLEGEQVYREPGFRVTVWGNMLVFWMSEFTEPVPYYVVTGETDGSGEPDGYSSDINGANPTAPLSQWYAQTVVVTRTTGWVWDEPFHAAVGDGMDFLVTTDILTDTGGHDGDPCYICMPDEIRVTVTPGTAPGTYVIGGPLPWAAVTGRRNPDGSYAGTGRGEFAGYPGIDAGFDGVIIFDDREGLYRLDGIYVAGEEGGLPGGYATYWGVEGTQVPPVGPSEAVPGEVPVQVVDYFVKWNDAFASGDGGFLYSTLHWASKERYGGLQCQDYISSVVPSATAFLPDTATEVEWWEYDTDGNSTVVGNIWELYGEFTTPAGTTWPTSHVAVEGDEVFWFTDCGKLFEFEPGVELDDDYTVCGASCRKREKIVEAQKVKVWCMNDQACADLGCECHLFSRDKDDAEDDPDSWEHVAGPMVKMQKDNDLAYRCFCVE